MASSLVRSRNVQRSALAVARTPVRKQSTALTTPSYFERVNAVKTVAMEAASPENLSATLEATIPQLPNPFLLIGVGIVSFYAPFMVLPALIGPGEPWEGVQHPAHHPTYVQKEFSPLMEAKGSPAFLVGKIMTKEYEFEKEEVGAPPTLVEDEEEEEEE